MKVILLEKIRNLGDMGATVSVAAGYARNYLVPYGKAVIATAENSERFAKMRAELEKRAEELLHKAEERAAEFANVVVTIEAKATDDGKLFGSIGAVNIVEALKKQNLEVKKSEISLPNGPFHQVGEYEVPLLLHTDIESKVKLKIVALA